MNTRSTKRKASNSDFFSSAKCSKGSSAQKTLKTKTTSTKTASSSSSLSSSSVKEKEKEKNDDDYEELTIERLMELAKMNSFPKKELIVEGIKKHYTSILNFFILPSESLHQEQFLHVYCKICDSKLKVRVGKFRNLNGHLDAHYDKIGIWLDKYKADESKVILNDDTLYLVKYFITSNTNLTELENPYLRELLKKNTGFKLPSYRSFRNELLPEIMKSFHIAIEKMLKDAATISLIIDMWSSKSTTSFMAIGAQCCSNLLTQEFAVISIDDLGNETQSAQMIKGYIEAAINKYSFDKSKINCN